MDDFFKKPCKLQCERFRNNFAVEPFDSVLMTNAGGLKGWLICLEFRQQIKRGLIFTDDDKILFEDLIVYLQEYKTMEKQPLLSVKPILTSLAPLLLAGISFFLESSVSFFGSKNSRDQTVILEDLGDFSQERSITAMVVLQLEQLRMLFVEVYNDYFVFLAVMLILHFLIHYSHKILNNQIRKNNLPLKTLTKLLHFQKVKLQSRR